MLKALSDILDRMSKTEINQVLIAIATENATRIKITQKLWSPDMAYLYAELALDGMVAAVSHVTQELSHEPAI